MSKAHKVNLEMEVRDFGVRSARACAFTPVTGHKPAVRPTMAAQTPGASATISVVKSSHCCHVNY